MEPKTTGKVTSILSKVGQFLGVSKGSDSEEDVEPELIPVPTDDRLRNTAGMDMQYRSVQSEDGSDSDSVGRESGYEVDHEYDDEDNKRRHTHVPQKAEGPRHGLRPPRLQGRGPASDRPAPHGQGAHGPHREREVVRDVARHRGPREGDQGHALSVCCIGAAGHPAR